MASARVSSGCVGHFSPEDQLNGGFQKKPIKEEPEDEDYHCKKKSLCYSMIPGTHLVLIRRCFWATTARFLPPLIILFALELKWKYLTINDGISGEETSIPVVHRSPVDEQNEEFQIMLVKEEESDDEGSICTATVCGNAVTLTLSLKIALHFIHIKKDTRRAAAVMNARLLLTFHMVMSWLQSLTAGGAHLLSIWPQQSKFLSDLRLVICTNSVLSER